MKALLSVVLWTAIALVSMGTARAGAQGTAVVTVAWHSPVAVVKTTPTLQVVVNPMLRRGSPIHDGSFEALKQLHANYVRYVPWLPYPKLAVAELKPPTRDKTFWNFKLIDPMMEDFMAATAGHPVVVNFSTIPQWMFVTPKAVPYPSNPDQVDWDYEQGTALRDPTLKQLGNYYARLVSWYTRGGFTDEHGVFHKSPYHYKISCWEVLNEVDAEHWMTAKQYTKRYDAIAGAILRVAPHMKFMGLALSTYAYKPKMMEYFLNHANHASGIPLNFISYHFYAIPSSDQTLDNWQYTFFAQADGFLSRVKYIETIRERLSPATKTDIDELGTTLPNDNQAGETPEELEKRIPDKYWNLSGALFAYLYIGLAKQGIDAVGESQLVGYPTQVPSVTMIDWRTGRPNARYWVLKLIRDNISLGDEMVETSCDDPAISVQAFKSGAARKLLIINKRDHESSVELPSAVLGGIVDTVDPSRGEREYKPQRIRSLNFKMEPFAVSMISFR